MKRIAIVTDNLRTQINGVVTTFNSIEKYANEDGYDLCFIDPSHFKHYSAPLYPEVKLSLPFNIGERIDELYPNHIHIATEGPIGLAARLYCDKKGYVYNTSYHTKFPEFMNKLYHIPTPMTYSYLRWFHKHSGIVLTNTKSMVETLQQKGFDGKIVEWTRGVDFDKLKATVDDVQNESVLYVGRVSREKNLDALCKLQDQFDIVIVGDGPYREALKRKYTKVKFVGYKTGTELANYYRQASVFCFPSLTDTFGIVIIEAMSQGCPVAAFPVTGPMDIIENQVTGVISLDLEKAIKQCLVLDRNYIRFKSRSWNWYNCWVQFKENLVNISNNT
jgi:glycosyltransferase involved in cell wall biosynthesis